MKKLIPVVASIVFVMSLLAIPCHSHGDEVSDVLKKLAGKSKSSFARVSCRVEEEIGTRTMIGTGICLSGDGLFMTLALDVRIQPEKIAKLEVSLPGDDPKPMEAKLLGIDPMSGLSFLKISGVSGLTPVKFVKKSGLQLGDPVFSVGLNLGDPASSPVLGQAYVSGVFRTPGTVISVTGGTLSGIGSVVFDSAGHAVGLITSQPYQRFQMAANNRVMSVPLRNRDRAIAFVPVSEFVSVIMNIPRDGKVRRIKWIGVGVFKPVLKELAEAKGVKGPAVMIDQVIPGRPADKAGLKNRDLIVGLGGKPLDNLASPALVSRNFARELFALTGSEVKLSVRSGSATREVTVKLEPMPTLPSESVRLFHKGIGLLMREKVMLDSFIDESPTAGIEGLLVVAVARNSPAARSGLQKGDVVTAVNSTRIKAADECKKIIDKVMSKKPYPDIRVEVKRGTETLVVNIKPQDG